MTTQLLLNHPYWSPSGAVWPQELTQEEIKKLSDNELDIALKKLHRQFSSFRNQSYTQTFSLLERVLNESVLRDEIKKGEMQLRKRRYLVFFCNLYLFKELTALTTVNNPSYNWVRMEVVSLLIAFSIAIALREYISSPTGWLTKPFPDTRTLLIIPFLLYGSIIGGNFSQRLSLEVKVARIFVAMIPAFLAVKESVGLLNPLKKPESLSDLLRNHL